MDCLMMLKLFSSNTEKMGSKLQRDAEEREEVGREVTELEMAEYREWKAKQKAQAVKDAQSSAQ